MAPWVSLAESDDVAYTQGNRPTKKRPLIRFEEGAMDRPFPAPRSLRKRAAAVGSASHAYGTTLGDLLVSAPLFSPLLSGVGAERVAFGEALNV